MIDVHDEAELKAVIARRLDNDISRFPFFGRNSVWNRMTKSLLQRFLEKHDTDAKSFLSLR